MYDKITNAYMPCIYIYVYIYYAYRCKHTYIYFLEDFKLKIGMGKSF